MMSMYYQAYGLPAVLALGTIVAGLMGLLVNVVFAIGVLHDAQARRSRGEAPFLVGPAVWAVATLLGGVFAATAYWAVHHSALRAPDRPHAKPPAPEGME
jgi:hypothetical protein